MKLLTFVLITIFSTFLTTAQNVNQGLKVGDKAPNFTLNNQNGESVALYTLLEKGPVILTWYRGGWCPYCNLALKELADKNQEVLALGATLVALSPELPDQTLSTSQKNELSFQVLSDLNNDVARQFDLVFKLTPEVADAYESKFALSKHNGSQSAELPIPATYIIDERGIIRYAYLNPDYKKRADVEEVMAHLIQQVRAANNNKLVVVWSSDDPMVAERVALMYSHAAKRVNWFSEVTLVIWGPSANLIAQNLELQQKIAQMRTDGVKIEACIACSEAYGVTDQLKSLAYDVLPMGKPLSDYLQQGYQVITF